MNQRIRVPEVRVVLEDGEQLGIMSRDEALATAREKGLDLVEITARAKPPRLLDRIVVVFMVSPLDLCMVRCRHAYGTLSAATRPAVHAWFTATRRRVNARAKQFTVVPTPQPGHHIWGRRSCLKYCDTGFSIFIGQPP